jgi:hypothetical protein
VDSQPVWRWLATQRFETGLRFGSPLGRGWCFADRSFLFCNGFVRAGVVLVRDWFDVASRLLHGWFAWLVLGWVTSV